MRGSLLPLTIPLGAAVGILTGLYFSDQKEQEARLAECSGHVVASVGGCDRNGDCGVILDNGHKMILSRPVVGERCR
jgi:hypothetical protein